MTAVGRSFLPILEREGLPDRLLGDVSLASVSRHASPSLVLLYLPASVRLGMPRRDRLLAHSPGSGGSGASQFLRFATLWYKVRVKGMLKI
jgi:hypothetical protein